MKKQFEILLKEYKQIGVGFVPVDLLIAALKYIKTLESELDTERISRSI